ncbi:SixA phosphatase family protein [Streptomyces chrestomyceticus]|uniref:SixA phosphatase family protein n=1 Tax=Streptomyces chrestomyceticus TaxID=68185 RepID=UPI0019D048E5|nr:histidine phosphatase family protein [Streptomyces chrestomyceticus]
MSPLRRLLVLRHAESARPSGVKDCDRPLTPRGRGDAHIVGRVLAESHWLPDLVLSSTARRARETWDLAATEMGGAPSVRYDPWLYHPSLRVLLQTVRDTPRRVHTLLLVGHNPSVQEAVVTLAGDGVGDALRRVRAAFPTAAIARLTWWGAWTQLTPDSALLIDVAVPHRRED